MLQKFDERNRDLIVNVNGQLIHRDKAGISPFDSAVQGGDAVWEGLRLYRGRIFKLQRASRSVAPIRAPRFLSPKFRLAKKSSKKSSAPLPLTRCRMAFTFA